jgi:hypothetical protein
LAIAGLLRSRRPDGRPGANTFDTGEWRGAADGNGEIIELKDSDRA